MQYAVVDSARSEAFKKGQGSCPVCGGAVIAKCGPRVAHHWAHTRRNTCDPWWENETAWHRSWKNCFPEECREVIHASEDGEIHRADIRTRLGVYIEVQHSSLSDAERISREDFYQNLVWVVDGRPFQRSFRLGHILPDPDSELGKDLIWYKAKGRTCEAANAMFFRISTNRKSYPALSKTNMPDGLVELGFFRQVATEIKADYRGHHQYEWRRPRRTWLDAACPVFIDFGYDFLCKLEKYDETGLSCVRFVPKRQFLNDLDALDDARAIGQMPPSVSL